jgi:hypothetical protein
MGGQSHRRLHFGVCRQSLKGAKFACLIAIGRPGIHNVTAVLQRFIRAVIRARIFAAARVFFLSCADTALEIVASSAGGRPQAEPAQTDLESLGPAILDRVVERARWRGLLSGTIGYCWRKAGIGMGMAKAVAAPPIPA